MRQIDWLRYMVETFGDTDKCLPFHRGSALQRPTIQVDEVQYQVTHLALEISGQPRPGNLHALHICETPTCYNPNHLCWGTPKENMRDAQHIGRPVGKKSISKDTLKYILELSDDGWSGAEIARVVGLAPQGINRYLRAHRGPAR